MARIKQFFLVVFLGMMPRSIRLTKLTIEKPEALELPSGEKLTSDNICDDTSHAEPPAELAPTIETTQGIRIFRITTQGLQVTKQPPSWARKDVDPEHALEPAETSDRLEEPVSSDDELLGKLLNGLRTGIKVSAWDQIQHQLRQTELQAALDARQIDKKIAAIRGESLVWEGPSTVPALPPLPKRRSLAAASTPAALPVPKDTVRSAPPTGMLASDHPEERKITTGHGGSVPRALKPVPHDAATRMIQRVARPSLEAPRHLAALPAVVPAQPIPSSAPVRMPAPKPEPNTWQIGKPWTPVGPDDEDELDELLPYRGCSPYVGTGLLASA